MRLRTRAVFLILFILFGLQQLDHLIPNGIISITLVAEAAEKVDVPIISDNGYKGSYHEIVIEATKECKIYFTINGKEPSMKATLYKKPIILEAGKKYIVKAIAYKGKAKSKVTASAYDTKLDKLGEKVKEIIETNITKDMTDFEKVCVVMSYLKDNVQYDFYAAQEGVTVKNSMEARGALIYHKAICSGYSDAAFLLLNRVGIPCRRVVGEVWRGDTIIGLHAWNVVYVEDKWYQLDPQCYFMCSDSDFKESGYYWNPVYPKCNQNYIASLNTLTVNQYTLPLIDRLKPPCTEYMVDNLVFDDITTINNGFYSYNEYVKTVKISEDIKIIDESAFMDCISLENVELNEGLEEIKSFAFCNCTSLKRISIPDSVNKITNGLFYNCCSLETVDLGNGVEVIADEAFAKCDRLKSITLPRSIKEVQYFAFGQNTNIKEVIIPGSIKIVNDSLSGCFSIENIVLQEGVEEIDVSSYAQYTNLKTITIPKSVVKITLNVNHDITIIGYPGSYAETYANNYNGIYKIYFKALSDS